MTDLQVHNISIGSPDNGLTFALANTLVLGNIPSQAELREFASTAIDLNTINNDEEHILIAGLVIDEPVGSTTISVTTPDENGDLTTTPGVSTNNPPNHQTSDNPITIDFTPPSSSEDVIVETELIDTCASLAHDNLIGCLSINTAFVHTCIAERWSLGIYNFSKYIVFLLSPDIWRR